MKPKKSKGRFVVPVCEDVDQVAKDAFDRGEIGAEVYEKLVQAGMHDMREPGVFEWKDTAVAYEEAPPPAGLVEEHVEEYIEVSAPPLSPPAEIPSMDEYHPEEAQAPEYPVQETISEVEVAEEHPGDGVIEVVEVQVDTGEEQGASEEGEATGLEEEDKEDEGGKGWGFLWCFGCGRVDVIMYGSKSLSDYFQGASIEVASGIVLIFCGSCRGTPARSWQGKAALETSICSSFQNLKLMPQMLEGSEAVQA
ncbi:hypothetical protein LTR49_027916, partial [Elasticomyces elasticus]